MTTKTSQKQGCLSIIFPFLGGGTTKTTFKAREYDSSNDSETIIPETLPYRVRDDFLSPAEFSFYKVLSSLGGAQIIVQSKIRLADIFFVSRPNENMAYFSKITQKHLDFLVCDSLTMKPLLGIELDDSSHKRGDRQERDDFVESVFQAAGLPLLRLPVQREYNTREIAAQIAPFLEDKVNLPVAETQPEMNQQASSVPLCPKCGIPMTLRTAAQGKHIGKQFYGCQNYPRCREVKPVIE